MERHAEQDGSKARPSKCEKPRDSEFDSGDAVRQSPFEPPGQHARLDTKECTGLVGFCDRAVARRVEESRVQLGKCGSSVTEYECQNGKRAYRTNASLVPRLSARDHWEYNNQDTRIDEPHEVHVVVDDRHPLDEQQNLG